MRLREVPMHSGRTAEEMISPCAPFTPSLSRWGRIVSRFYKPSLSRGSCHKEQSVFSRSPLKEFPFTNRFPPPGGTSPQAIAANTRSYIMVAESGHLTQAGGSPAAESLPCGAMPPGCRCAKKPQPGWAAAQGRFSEPCRAFVQRRFRASGQWSGRSCRCRIFCSPSNWAGNHPPARRKKQGAHLPLP